MKKILTAILIMISVGLQAQWISDGESGLSVRNKLNAFYTQMTDSLWQRSTTLNHLYPAFTNDSVGIGNQNPTEKLDVTGNVKQDTSKYSAFYWTDNTTGMVTTGTIQAGTAIQFGETTTPTAKIDTGAIYTKTDNELYFQDGAGAEHALQKVGYGEIFSYHEGASTTIDEGLTDNLLFGWNSGSLNKWTYTNGGTGAITAAADGGGGTVTMTSAANGLLDSDIISIRGTTNYNGVWEIDSINVNQFKITTTWVSNQTGGWDEGDHLTCGITGTFFLYCSVYGFSDASAKEYQVNIYKETTKQTDIWIEKTWATLNVDDGGSMGGFIAVNTGERIYISLQCVTDGTDFTIRSANLSLHKL